MTQVGRYCKALPAASFCEFEGWPPDDGSRRDQASPEQTELDAYWFLHDTYVVTRGIVPDEDIVFDRVSPEWIRFCHDRLGFAIPADLLEPAAPGAAV
jgi:hypothetical protein